MLVSTNKPVAESGYHYPDPLVWLLGHTYEAMVVVQGVEITAHVDPGSQISALTEGFCAEMGLRILPLRNLIGGVLHLEGMWAFQYCTRGTHRLTSLYRIYPDIMSMYYF